MKNLAFAVLVGLCLGVSLVLAACSSAGKCKRGELGCACTKTSGCDTGLMCDDKGMCVTRGGGSGTGGSGGGAGNGGRDAGTDAGKKDAGGGTDAGKKDAGGTDAGNSDAGKIDAGSVTCTSSSFDAACRAFCQAFCDNEDQLCVTSKCKAGQCDPGGELYKVCAQRCGTDASCVQSVCQGEKQRTCDSFGFKDMTSNVYQAGCFNDDPACVLNPDYGCSDTCGSLSNGTGGDLAGNGQCEDGGKNSTASSCPRGTDCTDCGMRTCSMSLGGCTNHGDCCGFYAGKSLCVAITSGGPGMCLQTCDPSAPSCPSGSSCLMAGAQNVCAPSSAH